MRFCLQERCLNSKLVDPNLRRRNNCYQATTFVNGQSLWQWVSAGVLCSKLILVKKPWKNRKGHKQKTGVVIGRKKVGDRAIRKIATRDVATQPKSMEIKGLKKERDKQKWISRETNIMGRRITKIVKIDGYKENMSRKGKSENKKAKGREWNEIQTRSTNYSNERTQNKNLCLLSYKSTKCYNEQYKTKEYLERQTPFKTEEKKYNKLQNCI